jgi:hypothetical protein
MCWNKTMIARISLLLLVIAPATEAQRRVEVRDAARCGGCSVQLKTVATLRGEGAPAAFPSVVRLARNSKGSYVMSASTFVGELFLFSSDGRFQSAIGRRGEGPSEFAREQLLMFDAHDSLHAVAIGGGRHSVLGPSLARVERSALVSARVLDARWVGNGQFLALAPTSQANRSYALQLLGREGVRAIAFDEVPAGAQGPLALGRALAIDPQGGLWSGAFGRYQLRSWDAAGQLRLEAEGRRPWFQSSASDQNPTRRTGPSVQLGGIEFDEEGLLWLFFLVPSVQGGAASAGGTSGQGAPSFSTVIEVIEPREMQLLATGRYPRFVLPFQRGLAYTVEESPAGETDVRIMSLRLRK